MSATDELRALLDERGVEYETYVEQPTGFEHVKWNFNKHGSADFNLEFGEPWLTMYGVISGPEQAVAATLGTGTCHLVRERVGKSGKAYRMVCSECHHVIYDGWQEKPRYCAFCGARLEDE